jgi:hypothetical protein
MTQKEWKQKLGGAGKIEIHKFPNYTVAISRKYGSYGIQYHDITVEEIKQIEDSAQCTAKELFYNHVETK